MVVCGRGEGWATFARRLLVAGVCALLLAGVSRAEALQSWIMVDTREHSLSVWDQGRLVDKFEHIAIGRKGASELKYNGDKKTPVGRYRVTRITRSKRFHLYIGLDYPNLDDARRARDAGILDEREFDVIRRAIEARKVPPQDTVLGGHIGIHGIGRGDPEIHELFDWTNGCIALTNEEIDRLARRVRVGTLVVIR